MVAWILPVLRRKGDDSFRLPSLSSCDTGFSKQHSVSLGTPNITVRIQP
jgi:hypothetical protein